MQTNGSTSCEATPNVLINQQQQAGNEQVPETVGSGNSQAVQSTNGVQVNQSGVQANQSQQHQLRPPSSPPGQQLRNHHQQQASQQHQTSNIAVSMTSQGAMNASHQNSEHGIHHTPSKQQIAGAHRQTRQHQASYHGQHQMQHYHQQQQNKYSNPKGDSESNINHIILITVINPHYPINCDLIHQICCTYGKVIRIVIFKKNGIQAMVEFDNVDSAKRAKTMLSGCDIYSGCCTLRIEYAKPARLNVHKNDNDSFDYTNPNLGNGGTSESGLGPGEHHAQPSHHHHTHHSHGGLNAPSHSNYHHGGGSSHHSRGGVGGLRRAADSGQNHHAPQIHPSQQHMSNNQHMKQATQQSSGGQTTASNYNVSQPPMDQPGSSTESFHPDGGFGVSRSGPPPNYVNVDPFMSSHSGPHAMHGSVYPRQDGIHSQHPHHQPHHHSSSRGPMGRGGPSHHNSSFVGAGATNALLTGPSNFALQGTVMMVYGLNPNQINCDRLFNLFCLYGNVVRVKFLRSKEGCAMVQMGDMLAVDRCVSSLNKITLFGSELQISYSKQAFLHDVPQPFILPDGSLSFKDFMGSKNNRFKTPEVASKNRILPPSQVLHFFNAPLGITEEELVHLLKQTAGHEPISLKIFNPKSESSKSFSGLVTMRDPVEATETLVLCNHLSIPKPGAPHPFILRLCFSPPTYARSQPMD